MFPLSEDMFMPGEAFVQMNFKIFDIFCLRERSNEWVKMGDQPLINKN
jgi:hypothetical protein